MFDPRGKIVSCILQTVFKVYCRNYWDFSYGMWFKRIVFVFAEYFVLCGPKSESATDGNQMKTCNDPIQNHADFIAVTKSSLYC